MCGFVVSVFQALGVTIKHPVVLAVAIQQSVQSLRWPVAHAESPLSHSLSAGRIAASPLCFSGPPQLTATPLSSAIDIILACAVTNFYMGPSIKKSTLPYYS